jgi:nucleotidyltransferase AbiEii toxin of type IV toxin-antitoxin system
VATPAPLSRVQSALGRISVDLKRLGYAHALVGGLAVAVRTEPRFTRDADLAVSVTDDRDAEALVHELQAMEYRVAALVEQEATRRLATVRLIPPGERERGVVVDLLFASSGVEREIATEAEIVEVMPGLNVPVARAGHLIALKILARDDERRPQDHVDLVALRATADAATWDLARSSLVLVTERGFDRGRDLLGALDQLRWTAPAPPAADRS